MADQEMSIVIDADTKARIGAIAALSGLPEQEVTRLLLEQAISDGVDRMIFDIDGDER